MNCTASAYFFFFPYTTILYAMQERITVTAHTIPANAISPNAINTIPAVNPMRANIVNKITAIFILCPLRQARIYSLHRWPNFYQVAVQIVESDYSLSPTVCHKTFYIFNRWYLYLYLPRLPQQLLQHTQPKSCTLAQWIVMWMAEERVKVP